MTKRLTWVGLALTAGCVFTPRPMIPFRDDAGDPGLTNVGGDAGRGSGDDAATGAVSNDAGTGYFDAAASDAPPAPFDSLCRRASDAGDSGYVDRDGQPCDPTVPVGDAGARDVPDAACDGPTDAGCEAGAGAGLARERR